MKSISTGNTASYNTPLFFNHLTNVNDGNQQLIHEWEEWSKQAINGPGEDRNNAVARLKEYLQKNENQLDLSNLFLTELPENFPNGLIELRLDCNRLTQLPANLPTSVTTLSAEYNNLVSLTESLPPFLENLELSNNQLTLLPDALPEALKTLDVSRNLITLLPESLPDSLTSLRVLYNQLNFLPNRLPQGLTELNASNNQLLLVPDNLPSTLITLDVTNNQLIEISTTLPPLLENLDISNNQLFHLTNDLPESLVSLDISNNQLTALPDNLPRTLVILYARNNRITRLPASLPPCLRFLSVRENEIRQFPNHLPTSLVEIDTIDNPLFTDPINLVNSDPVITQTNQPRHETGERLIEKIKLWDEHANVSRWDNIKLEEDAEIFANFLHNLYQGLNAYNATLKNKVSEWLDYLAQEENTDMRQQTFAIAHESIIGCVDRASFYFNKMYLLMIENKLLKSADENTTGELIKTALSLFRLQEINTIAAEQVKQRQRAINCFKEDLEIYLAYQYQLRDKLELPIHTELQFGNIANLTLENLEVAADKVKKQEKAHFLRYLVTESTIWNEKIRAWNKEKQEQVIDKWNAEVVSEEFERAINAALTKENVAIDDFDARTAIGKQMSNDLLYKMQYALTKEYLHELGETDLIVAFGNHPI